MFEQNMKFSRTEATYSNQRLLHRWEVTIAAPQREEDRWHIAVPDIVKVAACESQGQGVLRWGELFEDSKEQFDWTGAG